MPILTLLTYVLVSPLLCIVQGVPTLPMEQRINMEMVAVTTMIIPIIVVFSTTPTSMPPPCAAAAAEEENDQTVMRHHFPVTGFTQKCNGMLSRPHIPPHNSKLKLPR